VVLGVDLLAPYEPHSNPLAPAADSPNTLLATHSVFPVVANTPAGYAVPFGPIAPIAPPAAFFFIVPTIPLKILVRFSYIDE
jgi:hypothetical protein